MRVAALHNCAAECGGEDDQSAAPSDPGVVCPKVDHGLTTGHCGGLHLTGNG